MWNDKIFNEENEATVLKEEQCDKPDLGISILFMPISFYCSFRICNQSWQSNNNEIAKNRVKY